MQSNEKTPTPGKKIIATIIVIISCLLILPLFASFFTKLFEPAERMDSLKPFREYSDKAMLEQVSHEKVAKYQNEINAFGSRFIASPGYEKTREYIISKFQEAGLEVKLQHTRTAYPQTSIREIRTQEGTLLPDVEIYPFLPNSIQGVVTEPAGLEGQLIKITPDITEQRQSFNDCIGLIDARDGEFPPDFGFNWRAYATLGLKAVIIAHPEGMDKIPWPRVNDRYNGIVSSNPVNYVRVAATPQIFNYIDKRIRLHLKSEWKPTTTTGIIGILRAENTVDKALIIRSHYDACSILPDKAPGTLQALSPAVQLALLDGLKNYRSSLRRDIIFLADGAEFMAADSSNSLVSTLDYNIGIARENKLLEALGTESGNELSGGQMEAKRNARNRPWIERQEKNNTKHKWVKSCLSLFDNELFVIDPDTSKRLIEEKLKPETRDFLGEQIRYVLNTIVLERSETVTRERVLLEKEKMRQGITRTISDPNDPIIKDYLKAKKIYDEALAVAGYGLVNMLQTKAEFARNINLREKIRQRFIELDEYHTFRAQQLQERLDIVALFNPYTEIVTLESKMLPTPDNSTPQREGLAFKVNGMRSTDSQPQTMLAMLQASLQQLDMNGKVFLPALNNSTMSNLEDNHLSTMPDMASSIFSTFGYPHFTIVNMNRVDTYESYASPVDLPYMHNTQSIHRSLQVVSDTILSLAHGVGIFKASPTRYWLPRSYGGQVLVSNVGQSVVPNYPLKDAIVFTRGRIDAGMLSLPGYYWHMLKFTGPYGEYDLPHNSSDFAGWWNIYTTRGYSPMAASIGPDGLVQFMKDEGEEGQRLYKSVRLPFQADGTWENVTIVTFRASPMTIIDMTNPQTMDKYTGVVFTERDGLQTPRKNCAFDNGYIFTNFLDPTEPYYIQLRAGAAGNEQVQKTRAFLLNMADHYTPNKEKEIDGLGYLPDSTPFLLDTAYEAAKSMLFVNGQRLALQQRHDMEDNRTKDYQEKSLERIKKCDDAELNYKERLLLSREALTYATLNHPVIRESVTEAVWGIIWYLGLLAPFCFFFEKLVFGFPDIRKQITTIAISFLAVFVLLRYLHPAFEMVRSPLMILLGFIIIMISGGITLLFATKFRENLEGLRKSQGKVKAAEINVMGAIASAFMLGLNNMHRRKVRTGLTCITLILMTFVMICFTSVQSDLVDEQVPLGKAPYTGLLIKKEQLYNALGSLQAVRQEYGDEFEVSPRCMVFGTQHWQENETFLPELKINYTAQDRNKTLDLDSIVMFGSGEPLRDKIEFLTERTWFTKTDEKISAPLPAFIPDKIAQQLGITPQQVNNALNDGGLEAKVNGKTIYIRGIFSAESYNNLRDLDGLDLLPYDITRMQSVTVDGKTMDVEVQEDDPRIPAERLLLMPYRPNMGIRANYALNAGSGLGVVVSIAVAMPEAGYGHASDTINSYLERKAELVYYGLGGIAFRGKRTRESSIEGLFQMLIPLIIAALTVLNTMKGSVYERRDEIFVYNAVGIAPKYVFFMFFAEAIVYAVVGSVFGYLLSQGIGKIFLTIDPESELTGGLNMTFTSLMTIYASLAISASVFLSTLFPARSAMEIASPADDAGWDLPEPDGDKLLFSLPFTFNTQDRVAVLEFFNRFLLDHAEGSAGRFFSGPPQIGLHEELDELNKKGYIPQITSTVWLKPFDLGVSQEMEISMPIDPETGEFIARIELHRLSGTREAWMRLNKGYIRLVRRHFLHWRAVNKQERLEMFNEAQTNLRETLKSELVTDG